MEKPSLVSRIRSLGAVPQMSGVSVFDKANALPPSAFAELIDALYAPIGSFLIAFSCGIFVAGFVAVRNVNSPLLLGAGFMSLVGVCRVALVVFYRARDAAMDQDYAETRFWETGYAIGAGLYAACFGYLCYITFTETNDVVGQMLMVAVTVGFTAGATARNSSRIKIALMQVTLSLLPLSAGAAVAGGAGYLALSGMALLYLLAAAEIALYLSRNTLRLLLLNIEKNALATSLEEQNRRLDIALDNMSHGLCMFDVQSRLALSNHRMLELYGLTEGALAPGMSVHELVEKSVALGNHAGQDFADLILEYEKIMRSPASRYKIELSNGRVISWSPQPLEDGGAVVIFEDITERERAESRAQYLSTHDGLTGLPNRMSFELLLEDIVVTARREGKALCVMFVDLDRFKLINDTLGHSAGDELLTLVARRLEAVVGSRGVVARLGGDEFVIVFSDVSKQSEAAVMARRIVDAVAEPLTIADQECIACVSVGVAFYPLDARDAQNLIKCADAAMYRAKQDGKNDYKFYCHDVGTQSAQRLQLESDLRHALDRDQFVLYYQPKRSLLTGAVTGAEALVRWRHPERGLLGPDKFIPLAEETGFVVALGRWVLETACRQNMLWIREGLPQTSIAVNLSPRQFASDRLHGDIECALEKSGMPAHLLEVEITESLLMQNFEKSEELLRRLRDMGAHIAIDDFGTGYSSLSRLKDFPIDTLKIDRSFVRGMLCDDKNEAITGAVIALGRALDMTVIAEGVETPEQEAFLRARGCDQMQGFLFSRPIPAEDYAGFVHEYNLSQLLAQAGQTIALRPARIASR